MMCVIDFISFRLDWTFSRYIRNILLYETFDCIKKQHSFCQFNKVTDIDVRQSENLSPRWIDFRKCFVVQLILNIFKVINFIKMQILQEVLPQESKLFLVLQLIAMKLNDIPIHMTSLLPMFELDCIQILLPTK